MLSREQVRKILNSYPITEYEISYDRLNYKYNNKVIACELSHTGNGYISGKEVASFSTKYKVNSSGWISIKGMKESEVRELLELVISQRDKMD